MFSISILSGFGLDYLINAIKEKNIKLLSVWILICSGIFFVLWGIIFGKIIDERFYQIAAKNMILPSALFAGLFFAIIISLLNKKFIKISVLIIVILITFDLLRFATKWQPFESIDFAFPTTPIITKLTSLDNKYRFFAPFGAEGAVYYKLPVTDGYDPLYINRYGEFVGTLKKGNFSKSDRVGANLPVSSIYARKVLDFLSIKHILVKRSDRFTVWAFPFINYPENKFNLNFKEKDYLIYENKNSMPRANIVGDYTIETDNEKIMKKIISNDFNFRNNVVLEKNPDISPANNVNGEVKFIKDTPNEIILNAKTDKDSILVLSDNFYPGWKVEVDGRPEELLRANYSFRGVVIPRGTSEIKFYYFPDSFKYGVYLFILGIILIFIFLAGKWYTTSKWNKHKTAKSVTK